MGYFLRDDPDDDGEGSDPGDGSLFRSRFPRAQPWGSVKREEARPRPQQQQPAAPQQQLRPLRNTPDSVAGVQHATAYYDSRVLGPVLERVMPTYGRK